MSSVEQLRACLLNLPTGPIAEASEIEFLLADCWDTLVGDPGGMTAEKLIKRTEDVEWNAPVLTFCIERHGGTVLGSSRAEIQEWTVNVVAGTRSLARGGQRLLRPVSPRLDVQPIAEELAKLIEGGKQDPRLNWHSNDQIVVDIGEAVRTGDAAQQTVAERRKRFWKALDAALEKTWQRSGRTYVRI